MAKELQYNQIAKEIWRRLSTRRKTPRRPKVLVKVTHKHLVAAFEARIRGESLATCCPITRAIREIFPDARVLTDEWTKDSKDPAAPPLLLPPEVSQFIRDWDDSPSEELAEFEFELEQGTV
jgi:hypothetical protein